MKLLLVIDTLAVGGAQRQLTSLALGLKKAGHIVSIFTYFRALSRFSEQLLSAEIPIIRCDKRGRFSLGVVLAMRKLMRCSHYDAIISFLDTPNFYAEWARIGLRNRPALIVSERLSYPSEGPKLSKRLLEECHRLADHITVNSYSQCQHMISLFPWMAPKLSVIYNGVDLDEFTPANCFCQRTDSTRPRLLVLASCQRKKNAMGLARAVASIAQRGAACPSVSWVGGWNANSDTQAYKLEVDQFLEEAGIDKCWHWLGLRNDIPELIHTHDALVHPSFIEGLPNAVCEALASGVPVLASSVGEHPQLLGSETPDCLFDPHDEADIARALRWFSELPGEDRALIGGRNRKFAEANLGYPRMVRAYDDLITQMVAKTGI